MSVNFLKWVAVGVGVLGLTVACSGGTDSSGTSTGSSSSGGNNPCAPNGTFHDDHCDCDRGFIAMGLSCVPRPDAGMGGTTSSSGGSSGSSGSASMNDPDGCGPHGEAHAGHCDCDPGYFEDNNMMCVAPASCTVPDDAREQNDTPATANALTLPLVMEALQACPADADFYSFSLTVGQTVEVDLAFSNAAGDLDMYLWKPGQQAGEDEPAAGSEGTVDNEHFDYTADTAGVHVLLVRGYQGAQAPYQLSVSVE